MNPHCVCALMLALTPLCHPWCLLVWIHQSSGGVQMLGMHGTVFANFAVDEADLLLAFGVRFDDRVTGKLETFASKARVVHIDIDPAEICKNKEAHVMVCSDTRPALKGEPYAPCHIWRACFSLYPLHLHFT